MCIKAGDTELSSVKALMTMSLDAIVLEVFGMGPDEVKPELRLYADLKMTDNQKNEFSDLVAEYFDGRQLELTRTTTLGDIFDCVVEQEFAGIPANAFWTGRYLATDWRPDRAMPPCRWLADGNATEEMMVRVIARISSKADTAEQLRKILTELVTPSRQEPGCLSYELFQDEEDPVEFVTLEHWADSQAAQGHMATPHVAEAIARAASCLAQPPVIHRFKQLA
jgi:quinol monooxygenase YgiN